MNEKQSTATRLTPAEQSLTELWEKHLGEEFATRDTDATLETMVPDAYVNHIPVLTGGVGLEQLREFYSQHFIPKMPPDTEIVPISRTIGAERLVDEMIFRFTHTAEMDWMLPGIAPTGKLVQLGLLDSSRLPVAGLESARKLANPSLPSNQLIERAKVGRRP